jgi:hypothetical protein
MLSAAMHQNVTYNTHSFLWLLGSNITEGRSSLWCVQRERPVRYYSCSLYLCESVHINIGIVTKLWAGWSGVWFQAGARGFSFSFLHKIQQALTHTHSSAISLGSRHSLGVKWLGCEIDHLPLSSAKVKNEWSHMFTPPHAFVVWTGSAFSSY